MSATDPYNFDRMVRAWPLIGGAVAVVAAAAIAQVQIVAHGQTLTNQSERIDENEDDIETIDDAVRDLDAKIDLRAAELENKIDRSSFEQTILLEEIKRLIKDPGQ